MTWICNRIIAQMPEPSMLFWLWIYLAHLGASWAERPQSPGRPKAMDIDEQLRAEVAGGSFPRPFGVIKRGTSAINGGFWWENHLQVVAMFDTGGKLQKILSQKWALKFQPFFAFMLPHCSSMISLLDHVFLLMLHTSIYAIAEQEPARSRRMQMKQWTDRGVIHACPTLLERDGNL